MSTGEFYNGDHRNEPRIEHQSNLISRAQADQMVDNAINKVRMECDARIAKIEEDCRACIAKTEAECQERIKETERAVLIERQQTEKFRLALVATNEAYRL